jgi:hypothetical protein
LTVPLCWSTGNRVYRIGPVESTAGEKIIGTLKKSGRKHFHPVDEELGNGVKNLSGSADIPKFLIIIITAKEKPTLGQIWYPRRRIFVV